MRRTRLPSLPLVIVASLAAGVLAAVAGGAGPAVAGTPGQLAIVTVASDTGPPLNGTDVALPEGTLGGQGTALPPATDLTVLDARGVLAVATRYTDAGADAVVVDLGSGRTRTVLHHADGAALSGDSRKVYAAAGSSRTRAGASRIVALASGGGGPRTVVAAPPAGRDFAGAVAVSQDGRTLYACASTPLLGGSQADFARIKSPVIERVDLATGTVAQLHTRTPLYGVGCTALVPSPDGRRLAAGLQITQGDSPDVEVIDLATGGVREVGRSGDYRTATSWTLDSSRLYVQPANVDTVKPLAIVALATGRATPLAKAGGRLVLSVVLARPVVLARRTS